MTERGHRFFIGAATTRYHPASGLADRPELSAEVARMAELFTGQLGYERVSFGTDLSRIELITRLGDFLTHPDRTDRDLVVFYYTGHGEIRNGDLALPLPETTSDFARTAVWASELVRWLFGDTPVQRFLVILDTCHAAAGGAVVARGGMDYLNSLAGLASDPSIAVLAAARRRSRPSRAPSPGCSSTRCGIGRPAPTSSPSCRSTRW